MPGTPPTWSSETSDIRSHVTLHLRRMFGPVAPPPSNRVRLPTCQAMPPPPPPESRINYNQTSIWPCSAVMLFVVSPPLSTRSASPWRLEWVTLVGSSPLSSSGSS